MTRQILVTGGNSGIGLEMVRAFAAAGHTVVVAARDAQKTEAVLASLRQAHPQASLHAVAMDLSRFDTVDAAAQQVLTLLPALDTVMMNAGSLTKGLRTDPNGLESMIGSMHFGHFRLMQRLLPRLEAAPSARVVVTSSVAHWTGKIDPACMQNPNRYFSDIQAYGSAKLANLIYARELARRVAGSQIRVNAFHPGGVATGIWRELPGPLQTVIDKVMITPAKGADTAIWLALAPDAADHHGGYFVRRKRAATRAVSKDRQVAAELWALSEQLAGI
jgi:NAD(P)-dependent dehydrogenase (short-subunit alcohol dehydrogenase family)